MDKINEGKMFLTIIESIGYKAVRKLIERYESFENIFGLKDEEICALDILTEKQSLDFVGQRRKWNLDRYLEILNKNKIKVVTIYDDNYPKKLLNIPDPPFQLFYKGELPDERIPSVSIIGARSCSEYGKKCAKYFAGNLARSNVQIISGLASGIDGISQNEAVESGGKSYGILGCGVDVCYPMSNWEIYDKVSQRGGLISEFSPGAKPLAVHFPVRNRIISGLSDVVLVIEAKEKSGTAITVNMALEQGREVFAVPGRINDRLSDGCNRMIAEGAGIARRVEDILESLSISFCSDNNMTFDNKLNTYNRLINDSSISELSKNIGKLLLAKELSVDEVFMLLQKQQNIQIKEVRKACMELEINGYIKNLAGIIELA